MPTRLVAATAACIVAYGALVATQAPGATAEPQARVDDIFKEFSRPGSPGCAVGVYRDDRVVLSRAYGMANLDHDIPLTPSSVFHVASVSKQFTATAILLLVQDGKLSLDDEVRKHVPELPDFGPKITVRHLLNHTSGIRDQWTLLGLGGWRYARDLITDDDVLTLLSKQKDLNFTPGERHLYSNSGYTLLAVIVSRVSGKPFRQFTTERIFAPLGMKNTHFRDNFNEIVKNQAYGYSRQRDRFVLSVTNFDTAGATSLLTTVEDLAKWHDNFNTRTVGGDHLAAALLERGVLNDGHRIDYAAGIAHNTYRGIPAIGHGGADAGYRSSFVRFPRQGLGIATLCNLAQANPTELANRVADVYLADVLPPVPAPPSNGPEIPMPAEELAKLAGLYWNAAEASARRFVLEEGRLMAVVSSTQRIALKPLGSGRFVLTAAPGSYVTFEKDGVRVGPAPAGGVGFVRAEPFAPTEADLAAYAGTYRSDEIEPAFRMSVQDGKLRLDRLKANSTVLEPLIADTFSSGGLGVLRFVRDGQRQVTGFTLEAGRIRGMKFWKDTPVTRPSSR